MQQIKGQGLNCKGSEIQGSKYNLTRGLKYKTFKTSRAKTQILVDIKTAPSAGMRCSSSSTDAHRHHYTCNQWLEETALFSGYKSQRTKGHRRENWRKKSRTEERKKKTEKEENRGGTGLGKQGRPRTENREGEGKKKGRKPRRHKEQTQTKEEENREGEPAGERERQKKPERKETQRNQRNSQVYFQNSHTRNKLSLTNTDLRETKGETGRERVERV